MNEVCKTCIVGKLPPPVGTSDWAIFSRDSYVATFRAEGFADIEKIGLVYCKNQVEIYR